MQIKDSHIYIFNKKNSFNSFVGFSNLTEKFVNGDFIDNFKILFILSEDMSERYEVNFDKVKNLIDFSTELSIKDFTDKYSKEIKSIYDFKNSNNFSFSWLEIFQLAVLLSNSNNSESIKNLINIIDEYKEKIKSDF